MEATLSSHWKNLTIKKYDDTADPDEHLDVYITQVSLYTTNDAILCWVFPTSVKGQTLYWFSRLPLNTVESFDTLVARFETQFATSRSHHLTLVALVKHLIGEERTTLDVHGMFQQNSIEYLKPKFDNCHAPPYNNT